MLAPPLQLLLALSYRGVWGFHPLQRGQVEPKQKITLQMQRSTQVPGPEGMAPGQKIKIAVTGRSQAAGAQSHAR